METEEVSVSPIARIKHLGVGFSYVYLGFRTTADRGPHYELKDETVLRGVYRTSTAEARFNLWLEMFTLDWEIDE